LDCAQLKLHGRDPLNEGAPTGKDVPPELLMEVVEARELLSEQTLRTEQARAVLDRATSRISFAERGLAVALCAANARPGAPEARCMNLDAAEKLVVELQYWTKLADEAETALEVLAQRDRAARSAHQHTHPQQQQQQQQQHHHHQQRAS
jgi:hypothetical protein